MRIIEQTTEVEAPVAMVYGQWSRFEEFPRFMDGVIGVERLAEDRLRWHAAICGNEAEWHARITENVPCGRIAWRSEEGLMNAGVVTFQKLSHSRTRIKLRIAYDPEDVLKAIGDKLGARPEQVQRDLECFKEIVEDIAEDAA